MSKVGDDHNPLGNDLGELTNVLDDENLVIETFCSGGPKNYGYTIVDVNTGGYVKTEFKVRGTTLNQTTERKVNLELLPKLTF